MGARMARKGNVLGDAHAEEEAQAHSGASATQMVSESEEESDGWMTPRSQITDTEDESQEKEKESTAQGAITPSSRRGAGGALATPNGKRVASPHTRDDRHGETGEKQKGTAAAAQQTGDIIVISDSENSSSSSPSDKTSKDEDAQQHQHQHQHQHQLLLLTAIRTGLEKEREKEKENEGQGGEGEGEGGVIANSFMQSTKKLHDAQKLTPRRRKQYKQLIQTGREAEARGDYARAERCYLSCMEVYDGDDALTMRVLALCLKNGIARVEDFSNRGLSERRGGGRKEGAMANVRDDGVGDDVIVID